MSKVGKLNKHSLYRCSIISTMQMNNSGQRKQLIHYRINLNAFYLIISNTVLLAYQHKTMTLMTL